MSATTSTSTTPTVRRFQGDFACPVCGGTNDDKRGEGSRCWGFLSEDGARVHCTREDHARRAKFNARSQSYAHKAKGPCPCGSEHGPAEPGQAHGNATIDAVYPYRNAAGAPVMEVVRYRNPKGFRQRRPAGEGRWEWNLKGVSLVLYRLPELVGADRGRLVVVCEGEKDVDALRARGFVATCNPMGSGNGKWREEYGDYLAGRHVAVLPDNDSPGRDHARRVARSLHGKAASIKVVDLPGLPERGDASDYFGNGGTAAELEQIVNAAPPWSPLAVDSPEPGDERPVIVVTTERHEVVDQAVAALGNDPRVYQRAHSLVAVRRDNAPGRGFIRPPGSPVIVDLPLPTLGERLTEHADWRKVRKTREGDVETVAAQIPDWAVQGTAARGDWPRVRHLEAVVEAPILRPDGSILDTPGYDDRTGLLYEPGAEFSPVPDRPTRADAETAAEELLDLVADFPFACEPGRERNRGFDAAAWLSGLLTPLARFAVAGPCPMFLFDANVAGSGKSKLCDLIAVISSGRPMARTDYPDENDEMRKCITAIALAGERTMLLDNIAVTFGGSALDGALTGQTWRGRILGLSKMTPELPLFTIWYGTGNNVGFRGDAVRRVVQCRLDSPEERPEERTGFRVAGDLLQHALANRPRLVRAALTILRAYHVAGRPRQDLTPMDFVAWSEVVRSSVFWATGLDPCAGKRRILATDPRTVERISLINGWAALPGSEHGLTAAEALRLLKEEPNSPRFETLRAVLSEWSRTGDLPTARSVGMKLNAIKGQVIDGKHFDCRADGRGTWAWRVVTSGSRGTDGTDGT